MNLCSGEILQLNATVQGGNTPIAFRWYPGNLVSDSTLANPTVTLTNTETFVVKVLDAKGWWETDTVTVMVRPLPTITSGPDVVLWPGESGTITSYASGGTPPYSFLWTPGSSLQTPTSQNPLASPTVTTQYTVLVTDSFGSVSPISDTLLADIMTITQINPGITGFTSASLALGDYDNDNDLDLLISGQTVSTGYNPATKIYRNDNGVFTAINTPFDINFVNPALWADFDNDGDLDVFANYFNVFDAYYSLYKNNNSTFTNQNLTLTSFLNGDAKAIDYDNDGDLDVIACGNSYLGGDTVILFVNQNGTFTEVNPNMIGVRSGKLSIYDFDKDGDMDVAIAGTVYDGYFNYPLLQLYKNDHGVFTEVAIIKTEIMAPALNWADINGDGYDDLLVSGYYTSGNYYYTTRIYINFQTYIQEVATQTIQVAYGSFGTGDYDNDGDLDLLVPYTRYGKIYFEALRNDEGVFKLKEVDLQYTQWGDYSWIDYDKDHDLDLIVSGLLSTNEIITRVYRNNSAVINTPPTSPTNVTATIQGNNLLINWNGGSDAQTPTDGLTYNIAVSNVLGSPNVCYPLANLSTGYNKVVKVGNCGTGTSALIKGIGAGIYYISAQAIDNSFEGSPFSPITTVSVAELETDNTLQVYPNPTTGPIWITLNNRNEELCTITVIDITGKTIFTATQRFSGNTPEKIDLPMVSKGLYLIKVEGKETKGSQKVLVDTK